MTDTITPALSAEEWAHVQNVGMGFALDDSFGFQASIAAQDSIAYPAIIGTNGDVGITATDCVRVLAFLNHALPDDDPRKITRADVDAAPEMGDADLDAADSMDTSPRYASTLWRLAAKLAALLPPE